MMDTNQFNELRKACINQKMSYITFNFPLSYDLEANQFILPDKTAYGFAKPGLTYLLYRLERVLPKNQRGKWKKHMRQLYNEDVPKFVREINGMYKQLIRKEKWRKGKTWFAAVLNDYIYGIMTSYNPVSNTEVLDLVEKWGMVSQVTSHKLKPTEFTILFKSGNNAQFEYGLAVENGETGHKVFGYSLYIKRDELLYTFPSEFTKRHMKKVGEVSDNLREILAEIKQIRIFDALRELEAKRIAKLLLMQSKYAKIHSDLEIFYEDGVSLYSLVTKLAQLRDIKGYKTVCSNALLFIFNLVGVENVI